MLEPYVGTLLRNEAGSVGEAQQLKLRKVLQHLHDMPDVAGRPRGIDASWPDRAAMGASGGFREDPCFCRALAPLRLPPFQERAWRTFCDALMAAMRSTPLRQRVEDLPAAGEAILHFGQERNGTPWPEVPAMGEPERLRRHCWPCRARELARSIDST